MHRCNRCNGLHNILLCAHVVQDSTCNILNLIEDNKISDYSSDGYQMEEVEDINVKKKEGKKED